MGIRTRGIDWLFWVLMGIILFGIWAMNFAKPPLQTLGGVIFLVALFSPVIAGLGKALLRAAKWVKGIMQISEN